MNRDRENARIAASVFIQAPPARYALIPFPLQGGKVPRSARETVSPNKRYQERGPVLAPAFYFQGLEEPEAERGFGGEGDIAVASEASAGSARGAFTLAGAVLGRRGGLDIVVLVLDGNAGKGEREHGAAFESSSGLDVFYKTGGASALGDGELSVDLDRDLDSGGKCLAGGADLRADALVEEDRNDRVGRDD